MFQLSKEHQEYKEKVRDYTQKVVRDYAKLMDDKNEGGEKIVRDFGEMGLLGMKIPTLSLEV